MYNRHHLKTEKYQKPHDKSVTDHQDRMEEIMRYSKQLEGARSDFGDDEKKTIIFKLFPSTWQVNYKRSQTPIKRASMEDIMIFMSQEKEFADSHRKQTTKWQEKKGDGGRGRGRG